MPFDHVYQPNVATKVQPHVGQSALSPTVVLYGDLFHSSFKVLHHAVKATADSEPLIYIQRWAPPTSKSTFSPLYLGGYGVELALKSTEYKATDDQKVTGGTSLESSASAFTTDYTHGYDFSAIKLQFPDLTDELEKFEKHIRTEYEEVPRVKPVTEKQLKGQ